MVSPHERKMGIGHHSKWFPYSIHRRPTHPSGFHTFHQGLPQRFQSHRGGDSGSAPQKSHRRDKWSRFSIPPLHRAQENWRSATGPQPQAAQRVCPQAAFSDGNDSAVHTQRQGLPLSGPLFRVEAKPFGVDQTDQGTSAMGQTTGHQDIRLLGRLHTHGSFGRVGLSASISGHPEDGISGANSQFQEILAGPKPRDTTLGLYNQFTTDDADRPCLQGTRPSSGSISVAPPRLNAAPFPGLLCGEGLGDLTGGPTGPSQHSRLTPSQESSTAQLSRQLDFYGVPHSRSQGGTALVDHAPTVMERSLLHPRDGSGGGLYRLIPDWVWHCLGRQDIFRHLGLNAAEFLDQLPGIVDHLAGGTHPGTSGQGDSYLLRQYYIYRLREALWRHPVFQTHGTGSSDLEALFCNGYTASTRLHSISTKPGRSSVSQSATTARVGVVSSDIPVSQSTVGSVDRRLLCYPGEQTATSLHVLGMGSPGISDGRDVHLLDNAGPNLSMSPVESSPACGQEGTSRQGSSGPDHPQLAQCHLVSSCIEPSTSSTGTPGPVSNRLRKRRFTVDGQQQLDAASVEDPRLTKRARPSDLSPAVQRLLARAPTSTKTRHILTRFLQWCDANHYAAEPLSSLVLVNYLGHGHSSLNWSIGTIIQYSSVILNHFQATALRQDTLYTDFFKALNSQQLGSSQLFPTYDISGILSVIEQLGDNSSMPVAALTQKLCWLLAITGFLRPSDIERIDLDQSKIVHDQLRLAIIAPKEKRQGRPYVKSVIIHGHSSVALCPVLAYQAYISRVAAAPCIAPHPYRQSLAYNHLIRDLRSSQLPVSSERISNHIKSLMRHLIIDGIPWSSGSLPKARALGSTLAVQHGVSTEDAVLHGAWSSRSVFDAFYRLSRRPTVNLTTATLNG